MKLKEVLQCCLKWYLEIGVSKKIILTIRTLHVAVRIYLLIEQDKNLFHTVVVKILYLIDKNYFQAIKNPIYLIVVISCKIILIIKDISTN